MTTVMTDKQQRILIRKALWEVLKYVDQARPDPVSENALSLALMSAGLELTQHQLRCELDYLEDRKLLLINGRGTDEWTASIRRYGVDLREYTLADCDPGIDRPPMQTDQWLRIRKARWYVLLALNAARPLGAYEHHVRLALEGTPYKLSENETRRELQYLHLRGLIELERGPIWHAKLGWEGVNLVRYSVDCQPGIDRPEE